MAESEKAWERQKGESAKAFEAFKTYCDLGASRSYKKVSELLGKSEVLMYRWSSRWDWKERARLYDNHLVELETEEKRQAVRKMSERQIKTAVFLQAKGIDALKNLDLDTMRPRDMVQFVVEGARLERLLRLDEAGERVDARGYRVAAPADGGGDQPAERPPFHMPAELIPPHFSDVYRDILKRGHSEYMLAGGRGSAKSSFVAKVIPVLMLENPDLNVVVVRKVANTLRTSVYNTVIWAIAELGLGDEFNSKVSPMEITRIATGQSIYFFGLDDPLKLKSFRPRTGYCGVVWFEEFDQYAGMEEIRSVRQSVLRGGDEGITFMTFNPPNSRTNFANIEAERGGPGRLVSRTTYLTVPREWLGEEFLAEAELLKEQNPTAYEHEYMGIPNGNGGMVFENVVAEEITDEQAAKFDHIYNGIDWGWFPDPWAFNQMHFDAARRILYIFGELRGNKLSNQQSAEMLRQYGIGPEDLITADSAEPKSIQDYRAAGLFCRGAIKGPDSVRYSMKWLQSLVKIVIDPQRCPYTYDEFMNYQYERDREGNVISGYPDRNNHQIDAVRYATESVWKWMGK